MRTCARRETGARGGGLTGKAKAAVVAVGLLVAGGGTDGVLEARAGSQALVPFRVQGDAILLPLGGHRGDPERGRRIALDRRIGNCIACHALPGPDARFAGEIGPRLAGVGARLSEGQIRLRVVDQSRVNPETVMPPYYRIDRLNDVASAYRGQPVLTAAQIEDVVAYLASLRDQGGKERP